METVTLAGIERFVVLIQKSGRINHILPLDTSQSDHGDACTGHVIGSVVRKILRNDNPAIFSFQLFHSFFQQG